MAEVSAIAWTDSTFNPWIGCTKVSPGCDQCYAETLDKRHRWGGAEHWGPGVPRRRTSLANWKAPELWNRRAKASGARHLVFCASLADVFDNEAPEGAREDLWALIRGTPYLTWQCVTKRIGNAPRMLPADWGDGYANVWLVSTIVDQGEADRDLPKLLAIPARVHGVSYEPALGPVNWTPWLPEVGAAVTCTTCGIRKQPRGRSAPLGAYLCDWQCDGYNEVPDPGELWPGETRRDFGYPREIAKARLDWIIVGGESGKAARQFPVSWARETIAYGRATNTPVFVKQLGTNPLIAAADGFDPDALKNARTGAKWDDPTQWPEWLRVQEFPK